jgi:hypothetical protein
LNVKAALAECCKELLVPVIGSEGVPAKVEVQDTVAVPEPVTVAGVIVPQLRPDGTRSASKTVPANPLRAVMVTVEVAD